MSSKARKVRFLNTYEPVTTIFRDLLPALVRAGTEVEAVMSATEYRAPRSGLDQWLRDHAVRATRIPSGIALAKSRTSKVWAMLTYSAGAALYTLFGSKADLNVFMTQPPLFAAWGAVLRLLRGQRFACIVMDLYPDVAVASGQLSQDSLAHGVLRRLSRWVLRRADAVFVIGRCMIERLAADGVPRDRLYLVTNWADQTMVQARALEGNPYRSELGIDRSFVVLYSGNMGIAHTFDEVIEAADRLSNREDVRFVFVGDGARRAGLERAVQERGLGNVTFLPCQPRERLADSMALGNVHLITQRPGMEGIVVPSKAYSAFAAGRPVIYVGDPRGEIALAITENRVGVVVPPGNPGALAGAIIGYAAAPDRALEEGCRAAQLARSSCSPEECVERYQQDIIRILNEPPNDPATSK